MEFKELSPEMQALFTDMVSQAVKATLKPEAIKAEVKQLSAKVAKKTAKKAFVAPVLPACPKLPAGKRDYETVVKALIVEARKNNKPWEDQYGVMREASKGVNAGRDGINAAIMSYYGFTDKLQAYAVVEQLVAGGKIAKAITKGGVRLYLMGEAPSQAKTSGDMLLRKIKL